jgi:predicted amidohydrolase
MRSDGDAARSIGVAATLTAQALASGADLVVLPENYAGIAPPAARRSWAVDPDAPEHADALAPLAALTRGSDAIVVAGGVPERADGSRDHNTAFAIHRGRVVARYRKIHLFDADLPGGERHRESEHTAAGDAPVVLATPMGRVGLTICYDLRFGELYRALADAGAELIAVPAAFTVPTGQAHWELLLRARAVETQAFVLAAAQWGDHGGGRASWGHAMIVDPWGGVIAASEHGDAVVSARLDGEAIARARARLPGLRTHALPPDAAARVIDVR